MRSFASYGEQGEMCFSPPSPANPIFRPSKSSSLGRGEVWQGRRLRRWAKFVFLGLLFPRWLDRKYLADRCFQIFRLGGLEFVLFVWPKLGRMEVFQVELQTRLLNRVFVSLPASWDRSLNLLGCTGACISRIRVFWGLTKCFTVATENVNSAGQCAFQKRRTFKFSRKTRLEGSK